MTREEAIQILADLTDNLFLHTWEEQYKALHMAIEALKGGDAEILNEDFRPKYMQESRHDDGKIEVVRCKDCKHSWVYGKTTQWLACENVMEGQATDPDGYCYLGERREP